MAYGMEYGPGSVKTWVLIPGLPTHGWVTLVKSLTSLCLNLLRSKMGIMGHMGVFKDQ